MSEYKDICNEIKQIKVYYSMMNYSQSYLTIVYCYISTI